MEVVGVFVGVGGSSATRVGVGVSVTGKCSEGLVVGGLVSIGGAGGGGGAVAAKSNLRTILGDADVGVVLLLLWDDAAELGLSEFCSV